MKSKPDDGKQGSFDFTPPTGDQLKEAGMEKVLNDKDEWKAEFVSAGIRIVNAKGSVTSEEITDIVGYPPGHSSAIGAAMHSLACQYSLTKLHYEKARNSKSHSAVVARWAKR